MIEFIIGILAGIVGGLGMGGGTILILLLTFILSIPQKIAQSANIIFFIPTSIAAIIVNLKNKNINLKKVIPIAFWGIIGAFIGASISINMDVNILKKCFGYFLIFIAIYQVYEYIKYENRNNSIKIKRQKEDKESL